MFEGAPTEHPAEAQKRSAEAATPAETAEPRQRRPVKTLIKSIFTIPPARDGDTGTALDNLSLVRWRIRVNEDIAKRQAAKEAAKPAPKKDGQPTEGRKLHIPIPETVKKTWKWLWKFPDDPYLNTTPDASGDGHEGAKPEEAAQGGTEHATEETKAHAA
jgi:hypothetical protein